MDILSTFYKLQPRFKCNRKLFSVMILDGCMTSIIIKTSSCRHVSMKSKGVYFLSGFSDDEDNSFQPVRSYKVRINRSLLQ